MMWSNKMLHGIQPTSNGSRILIGKYSRTNCNYVQKIVKEVSLLLHRGNKRTLTSGSKKKSKHPSKKIRSRANAVSRTLKSSKNERDTQFEPLFGLRPVDYSSPPPIYISPPPPPPKPGIKQYLFPITLAVSLGLSAYFYINNKNDAYEYWSAMQTGGELPGVYDDDDDDDYDDDDDDLEEDEE